MYGTLAGHLAAVLPACAGWEDAAWALGRCWLEAAVDRRLAQVQPPHPAPCFRFVIRQSQVSFGGIVDSRHLHDMGGRPLVVPQHLAS